MICLQENLSLAMNYLARTNGPETSCFLVNCASLRVSCVFGLAHEGAIAVPKITNKVKFILKIKENT